MQFHQRPISVNEMGQTIRRPIQQKQFHIALLSMDDFKIYVRSIGALLFCYITLTLLSPNPGTFQQ